VFVLPAIDVLDGKAVRLLQGDYTKVTVYNEDIVSQAQRWVDAGATWLHMVDLDGARSGRPVNLASIAAVAKRFEHLKIQVGGGIRSIETVARILDAGITRVILGTALVDDAALVDELLDGFGSERLVAGIDARDGSVATQGWRRDSAVPATRLASELAERGIRHLVYTDIARDGAQTGIDAQAYRAMAEVARFPLIVSGGVTSLADIAAVRELGDAVAEGVIVGRALYEHNFTLADAIAVLEGKDIAKGKRG
jgi:phosphoribosylformimino-5-aminoimidazole carboxamide ribotide isomerase